MLLSLEHPLVPQTIRHSRDEVERVMHSRRNISLPPRHWVLLIPHAVKSLLIMAPGAGC